MTLSPPVRAAVLEVVRDLRDQEREFRVENVGAMILRAAEHAILTEVRQVLGINPAGGTLTAWARGKSREEVAQALERISTVG